MNKKTTYRPPHSDGKKNILKTPSTMNFDKSSTKSIVLDSSLSQSLSVKNKPARQVQTEPTKKQIKHPSQANEATANVKSGSKLKIKKTRPPKATERKQNIEMKPGTQTKQPSKQISISPVKQLQSPVSIEDTNGVPLSKVENGETSNKKIHKKKTNSKKRQDGSSNWMKLCATMNIDATVRKTKPVKRPAPDSNTEQTEPKRVKPGVWFDNVDKILIETNPAEGAVVGHANSGLEGTSAAEHDTSDRLVKSDSFKGVTSCVAMDCEMVGVGPHGEESILARVSIVNHFGVCLYDKFVLPREKVTDYRTFVSGVTADKLATGEEFTKVQAEVSKLLHGRILVGHAVHNDLKVLFLTHPHKMIRDTSLYKPFRALFNGRLPSLKKLTEKVLAVRVQEGQHSSVQDAQATMRLYTMYRQKWEKELRKDRKMDRRKKKKKQHITESV